MLNRAIKLLIIALTFVFGGCKSNPKEEIKQVSLANIGEKQYYFAYNLATDTIAMWSSNNLGYFQYLGKSKRWILDSILCFNNKNDRFISCILKQQLLADGSADDIDVFYGEKINGKWYFFNGANIFLQRANYQSDNKTPLTFEKLHEIAIKEVYSSYLTPNGEINEAWFTEEFENAGWCDTCKSKESFQKSRLRDVATRWLQRDTTQPIKRLEKTKVVLP